MSTKYLGGEKGGFQHKDFRRGRPNLLKEMGRTAVKRRVNHNASEASTSASSQSAKHKAISTSKTAAVATETKGSCSSSTVDSSPIHSSSEAYGVYISVPSNFIDPPRLLPAPPLTGQSLIDGPSTVYKAKSSSVVQPFSEDELIYLDSIFQEDENHSNYNELCSILSLDNDAVFEL